MSVYGGTHLPKFSIGIIFVKAMCNCGWKGPWQWSIKNAGERYLDHLSDEERDDKPWVTT